MNQCNILYNEMLTHNLCQKLAWCADLQLKICGLKLLILPLSALSNNGCSQLLKSLNQITR